MTDLVADVRELMSRARNKRVMILPLISTRRGLDLFLDALPDSIGTYSLDRLPSNPREQIVVISAISPTEEQVSQIYRLAEEQNRKLILSGQGIETEYASEVPNTYNWTHDSYPMKPPTGGAVPHMLRVRFT